MLKTYQAITNVYFATDIVMADKNKIRIAFEGGVRYPKRANGVFSTTSEELQKAIEKDASYGVEFKLIRVDGENYVAPKKAAKVVPPPPPPPSDDEDNEDEDDTEGKDESQTEPVKDFPDVTTVTAAKKILKKNFEKIAVNRIEVLAIAAEIGVTFPNLATE